MSMFVYAATPVGNLVINKGKIKLRRNNADLIMDQRNVPINVFNLDEIQTGKETSILIHLTEKNDQILLFSQSFFKIESVTADESLTSMSIGKVKIKVNRKLKKRKNKKRFRLKTTNALVGVKGTEFIISTGVDVTNVLTIEGIVSMANIATPNITVNVTENQVSQVKQNLSPTKPVTIPPEVQANILTVDSPEAFNQVQFGAVIEKVDSQSEEGQNSEEEDEENENGQNSGEKDPESTTLLAPPPPPPELLPELILELLPPEPPEIDDFEPPEIDDYIPEDNNTSEGVEIKITY